MPDQPLNSDALASLIMWTKLPFGGRPDSYISLDANAAHAVIEILKPHLTHTCPVVSSVPGVYDLGSPEPDGVDQVVECDEHGNPYKREWDEDTDYTWSKTTDGTRWKGYKDGKEYVEWPELVRRYGPVKAVTPEGGGDAT